MSLNPISDLHAAYLEEVLKPQLGPKFNKPNKSDKPAADLDKDGNVDTFEEKVRQFIYDVRHIMKSKNITTEKAFQIRASKTNYGAEVIKTAKEKLGIKSGGAPVSEEYGKTKNTERLYKIIIKYKNGTTLRKRTTQSEIGKLRNNPNVSSVEKTEYAPGLEYTEKKKSKLDPVGREDKDIDNDGDHDKTDKYLLNRRKVRSSEIQKRKSHGLGEEFSDWRKDLREVIDTEVSNEKKTQIKGMSKGQSNKIVINPPIEEKYSLAEKIVKFVSENINEKAESQQQQKLFGLALSVKRGETPKSETSPEISRIVNTMGEKEIRKFAKTSHKGLPKKVEEAVDTVKPGGTRISKIQRNIQKKQIGLPEDLQPSTPQQFAAQRQLANAQKRVTAADVDSLKKSKTNLKQQSKKQLQKQSFEIEGELVDEARAEEKRGLGSTGSERQRMKSGESGPRGRRPVTSFSGGQNPHFRGKDYLGKSQRRESSRRYVDQPGGPYGGPENKQGKGRYAAMQAKKRDQSYMHSRYD